MYGYLVGYAWDAIHSRGKLLAAPELGSGSATEFTPSAYYCGGAACYLTRRQWLESFLAAWGHKVDIVSVHLYGLADQNSAEMQNYGNVIRTGRRPYNWPLWLTEFGYEHRTPGADAILNPIVRGTFERMASGVEPLWKKSFVFDLYAPIGPYPEPYVLVDDMRSATPQPRQAFYCLQAVASGSPPPSYCY